MLHTLESRNRQKYKWYMSPRKQSTKKQLLWFLDQEIPKGCWKNWVREKWQRLHFGWHFRRLDPRGKRKPICLKPYLRLKLHIFLCYTNTQNIIRILPLYFRWQISSSCRFIRYNVSLWFRISVCIVSYKDMVVMVHYSNLQVLWRYLDITSKTTLEILSYLLKRSFSCLKKTQLFQKKNILKFIKCRFHAAGHR